MSSVDSGAQIMPEGARALLVASQLRCCPACGTPLRPRQRACSGRCRAALSRVRRSARQQARLEEIRALVARTGRLLGEVASEG